MGKEKTEFEEQFVSKTEKAKKLWEKYHTTEDIIQDAMMNQKSLRIWVRNTSECWCGIYYI